MGRIRVLDDVLANQIAAGEVVERPASVVKELLENSLDAGASAVTVEVAGGGVELLRVVDDGHGMDREDAVLALERHATSKLATASDLHHIVTLGFRGEAIPSIASVSRFSMRTRQADALGAIRVSVSGGRDLDVREAPGPVGTEIRVEDLFFNVPARRKFLKKAATEASHVQEAVQRLALCYPEVAFRLIKDGRTAFDLPRHAALVDRVRAIFGQRVASRLAPVSLDGLPGLDGLIGPPDEARATARHYHTFVNGRYVRDRVVMSAIQSAYGTRLERGRHPFVVLRLRLPPEALDVNVHPAKTEVRYVDGGGVHRLVAGGLDRALRAEPWRAEAEASEGAGEERAYRIDGGEEGPAGAGEDEGGLAGHRRRIFDAMERIAARRPGLGAGFEPRPAPRRSGQLDLGVAGAPAPLKLRPSSGGSVRAEVVAPRAPAGRSGWSMAAPTEGPRVEGSRVEDPPPPDAPPPWLGDDDGGGPPPPEEEAPPAEEVSRAPEGPAPTSLGTRPEVAGLRFAGLRPLAPLDGLLICAATDGLVGVDVAAARDRVRFDALLRAEGPGRALARPVSLDLDADARARLAARGAALASLGFAIEPFGGATHVVERVPAALPPERAEAVARAALAAELDAEVDLRAGLAAACVAAAPDGGPIEPEEAARLLAALDGLVHRPPRPAPFAFALTASALRRKLSAG